MSDLENHWHNLRDHALSDFRAASVSRKALQLLDRSPQAVLDVGCGIGVFTLLATLEGINCHGIDVSTAQVKKARTLMKRNGQSPDRIQECSLEIFVRQGKTFDSCVSLDVLEHIEDRNAFLRNLLKVLVPGGQLVVSVPATPAFYDERDRRDGHYLRYDRETLEKELGDAGWIVESVVHWNFLGWLQRKIVKAVSLSSDPQVYGFRYSKSMSARLLNWTLRHYFLHVENHLLLPRGMSLFAVATRPK